jgi:hypothetical protein
MWLCQAKMRFLRFQAPWAYGRNVCALLRRALAEQGANIRYQHMDVAENGEYAMHRGAPEGLM